MTHIIQTICLYDKLIIQCKTFEKAVQIVPVISIYLCTKHIQGQTEKGAVSHSSLSGINWQKFECIDIYQHKVAAVLLNRQ